MDIRSLRTEADYDWALSEIADREWNIPAEALLRPVQRTTAA